MANLKIEWSQSAKKDLINILRFYIERNGSAIYSKKLNSKINRSIRFISKNPLIGTKTDFNSVRALITGDYQITENNNAQFFANKNTQLLANKRVHFLFAFLSNSCDYGY